MYFFFFVEGISEAVFLMIQGKIPLIIYLFPTKLFAFEQFKIG